MSGADQNTEIDIKASENQPLVEQNATDEVNVEDGGKSKQLKQDSDDTFKKVLCIGIQGIVATVEISIALIWGIVFAIVAFGVDKNCDEIIKTWNIHTFYLFLIMVGINFISCYVICCITSQSVGFCANLIAAIPVTAALALNLYNIIDGIVVLSNSGPTTGCEAVYYTDLVYVILSSLDYLCIIFIVALLSFLLCYSEDFSEIASDPNGSKANQHPFITSVIAKLNTLSNNQVILQGVVII